MSALAGLWHFDGKTGAGRDCERMLAAQLIYGPHDVAQWNTDSVAVGRRLHRILPEDIFDAQPLIGAAGRYVLVADLRLDNRDELMEDLRIAPDAARRMADSAVLLLAWERWRENTPEHLIGDYAFAVWDTCEQLLFLARDPLGACPLHYHLEQGLLAFASMPKGLHALPQILRAPNEEHIAGFLTLLPEYGTASFFDQVERVPPGHITTIARSGITHRRHWEPQRKIVKRASSREYGEGLLHHLDQAVRAHLRGADGAVGAHLSSGFDSSAVATSAAALMAPRGGRVIAYTSVPREGYDLPAPPGRHGDEGPAAALTAARYANMEHVLIRGGHSPLDDLDRNFFIFDRPVLNICNAVWSSSINDAARKRKLRIVLSGQMGNMTISYGGETLLPQLMRSGRLLRWIREAAGLARNRYLRPLAILNATFGPYTPVPVWTWINKVLEDRDSAVESYSAILPARFAELDLPARAKANALDMVYRPRKDGFEARLWGLRRVDLGNHRKGTLGGWGIDLRDPTADRRLIEYCLSIPEDELLVNGQTRALSRRAFAGRLPREVIESRSKGYQAADWHESVTAARPQLREELARLEDCIPAAAALDIPRLGQLVENWPQGGWESEKIVRSYRLALLRGISAGHFLRRATRNNR